MKKLACLLILLLLLCGPQAFSQASPDRTQNEARERVQLISKRLTAGENFALLASKFSDDPATAGEGGLLGWFERDELNNEFWEVAAKLKVNEISQPFETRFGYHIVQLLEKKGNTLKTRHILVTFTE